MKNISMAVLAVLAVLMVLMMLGVANGAPIQRETRQFVFQPGSPSVRLYPVHYEHYLLNSSPGRNQLGQEEARRIQAFHANMLLPKMGKTEKPSTGMEVETKPITTTTTTRQPIIAVMEPVTTTLEPQPMVEAEEELVPAEPREDTPSTDLEHTEPVTESEMLTELAPDAALETATEMMPVMAEEEVMLEEEEEEVEAATEVFQDESDTTNSRGATDDFMTVTEAVPEDEVTTDFPSPQDLEVL